MDDWLKRWILRIVVAVVLAFVLTIGWIVYDGTQDSTAKADCAVVVGKNLGSDGKLIPDVQSALDRLVASLKANELRVVVLAVGPAATGDPKAIRDAMSSYLLAQGVPARMMLQDTNGTTPEAIAPDIAAYLTQANATSVLVVAGYSEITLMKLALHHAGVNQVFTTHFGAFQKEDLPGIARSAFSLWQTVFQHDVAPEAQQLATLVQTDAQNLVTNAKQSMTGSGSSASSGSTSAAGDVRPLSGGQTVNATGIGSFEVPRDWNQQIVYPITDPVWALPSVTGHPSTFLFINKSTQAGSTSDVASEVPSGFTNAGFSDVQTLNQAPFTTVKGQVGTRMVVTVSKNGAVYELALYAFPAQGDSKIVLCAGCRAADAATNLPLFDSCAKTLQIW